MRRSDLVASRQILGHGVCVRSVCRRAPVSGWPTALSVRLRAATAAAVVLAASAFGAAAQAPAGDAGTLVMPYRCSIEHGRVSLTPSAERTYRLVGPYREHAFTACAPGQPHRCRTWMIHRVDVQCANGRAPWADIVAAANDRPPRRLRQENGRIFMMLGPAWRAPNEAGRRALAAPGIALPPGYAPVVGIAARLSARNTPLPTVVEAPRAPASGQGDFGRLQKASVPIPVPAVRPPALPDHAGAVGVDSENEPADWVTTTERSPAEERAVTVRPLRVFALMALLAAAWLLVEALRAWRLAHRPIAATAAVEPANAALCSELIARAVNAHRGVREGLSRVTDPAVRKVLAADLAEIQSTLMSDRLTEQVASETWEPVRRTIEAALADLARIARRAEDATVERSSAVDVPAGPSREAAPSSAAEAYEVLGINPNASRTIVKKIVDGLRQSWHPDHARDEADRRLREDRMKQINTAWDIIAARQKEA